MKPEELAAEAFRLAAAGQVEASRPKWRRALDLARFASGPEAAVEVGLRWAEAEWRWGDPERAKRLARQQAELARRKGVRGPSLVRAELLLGRLAGDRSALEKALAHLVQATERAEGGEAPAGAAEWLDLALALASLAMWTQAEEAYGAAVKYALAGREKAKAWWGLGEVRYRLGRPREALEPARRALREARRTGQEDLVPELLGNMMSYLAEAGQVRRARRIWAVLERSPLPAGWERRRGAEVARVLWESGEHEEAVEQAERALSAGAKGFQAALAHRVLWQSRRSAGDEEGARAELAAIARCVAEAQAGPLEEGDVFVRLLRTFWAALKPEVARGGDPGSGGHGG